MTEAAKSEDAPVAPAAKSEEALTASPGLLPDLLQRLDFDPATMTTPEAASAAAAKSEEAPTAPLSGLLQHVAPSTTTPPEVGMTEAAKSEDAPVAPAAKSEEALTASPGLLPDLLQRLDFDPATMTTPEAASAAAAKSEEAPAPVLLVSKREEEDAEQIDAILSELVAAAFEAVVMRETLKEAQAEGCVAAADVANEEITPANLTEEREEVQLESAVKKLVAAAFANVLSEESFPRAEEESAVKKLLVAAFANVLSEESFPRAEEESAVKKLVAAAFTNVLSEEESGQLSERTVKTVESALEELIESTAQPTPRDYAQSSKSDGARPVRKQVSEAAVAQEVNEEPSSVPPPTPSAETMDTASAPASDAQAKATALTTADVPKLSSEEAAVTECAATLTQPQSAAIVPERQTIVAQPDSAASRDGPAARVRNGLQFSFDLTQIVNPNKVWEVLDERPSTAQERTASALQADSWGFGTRPATADPSLQQKAASRHPKAARRRAEAMHLARFSQTRSGDSRHSSAPTSKWFPEEEDIHCPPSPSPLVSPSVTSSPPPSPSPVSQSALRSSYPPSSSRPVTRASATRYQRPLSGQEPVTDTGPTPPSTPQPARQPWTHIRLHAPFYDKGARGSKDEDIIGRRDFTLGSTRPKRSHRHALLRHTLADNIGAKVDLLPEGLIEEELKKLTESWKDSGLWVDPSVPSDTFHVYGSKGDLKHVTKQQAEHNARLLAHSYVRKPDSSQGARSIAAKAEECQLPKIMLGKECSHTANSSLNECSRSVNEALPSDDN
ncbi:hypothetical protein CYMTET_20668 [Cymbomonas tetramitiformis]|uniref:Uncharacterized protein n=1 Tax=Cymbomonas tetramitiformis TaxID=36881 RepID=A0AAE0G3Q0_9CHLO|nr:hypothetical protein CYMTET_20668 [Cymbomonas tetramitiformis]